MRYVRNPTECDAFVIESVDSPTAEGMQLVHLKGGMTMFATKQHTARFTPGKGDYLVVSTYDGYPYFNPKDVFERNWHKWSPADVPQAQSNVPPPAPDKSASD